MQEEYKMVDDRFIRFPNFMVSRQRLIDVREAFSERMAETGERWVFGAEIVEIGAIIVKLERLLGNLRLYYVVDFSKFDGDDISLELSLKIEKLYNKAFSLIEMSRKMKPLIGLYNYGKRNWRREDPNCGK